MNKKEYITKLYEFTNKKNTTIYNYYKKLAILCRRHKQFDIIGFEASNPFLTPEDYKKLLSSSDELMPEFFARAMVKVIQYNDIIIEEEERKAKEAAELKQKEELAKAEKAPVALAAQLSLTPAISNKDVTPVDKLAVKDSTLSEQPVTKEEQELSYSVIKGLINAEYEKAAEREKEEKGLMVIPKKETSLAVIQPKVTSLVPVTKKEKARKGILSREDIRKIIENGFYKDDKKKDEIPEEIISQYLESKKPRTPITAIEAPKQSMVVPKTEAPEVQQPVEENQQKVTGDKKSAILDRILRRPKSNKKVEEVLDRLTSGAAPTQEEKLELQQPVEAPIAVLPKEVVESVANVTEPVIMLPAQKAISKDEILDSINQAMENIQAEEEQTSSALVPVTVKEEKPKKKGLFGITSINLGIIEKLKGFALIRESKTGKANLYYHNPKTNALKGRTSADGLKADSGYYVNYQEYIYKMIAHTMRKYPTASDLRFVNADGEERTVIETVEEVFKTLRDAGSIRFGSEYANAEIASYADLKKIKPGYGMYANEKLKKGIYVRKDILAEEFRKYKIRFVMKNEEIKVYKKTK